MNAAQKRIAALRRFAVSLTLFNLIGHLFLGFEQAYAQPLVALATAYSLELGLEAADAALNRRRPAFAGGPVALIDFLLPAHITGLATAMLLYANDQVWPLVFAVAVAIGSKHLFRLRIGSGSRHFFNPSNFGITITLLTFSWVGIAPPYHFTENLRGPLDWVLPALILASGAFLNLKLTGRIPLLLAWAGGFVAQAVVRSLLFGIYLPAALTLMTSVVLVLYTFYMVTDPATTPSSARWQVVFGAAVAAFYGLLVSMHVVFGLFFGLTITCGLRGAILYGARLLEDRRVARRAAERAITPAGGPRVVSGG
jgi:Na+-translocating ferredoxin:NAD+ oxidoreductase RnfD subunit